ncbi:MAG: tetratricopeptide repeat protein [Verrucomicrobiota bacterium]
MKNSEEKKTESATTPPGAKRRFPKWLIVVGLLFTALTVLGVGRHFYLAWQERRLIRGARFFMGQGKTAELQAVLNRALELNPNNLEAFRVSGQALLKENSAKALPWLRRVAELAPDSMEDQIALADAAFRFGQTQEAAKVVRQIETKARERADFQFLAGRIAQNAGQVAEAEPHFAEAVKKDPNNPTYQLYLAALQLNAQDAAVRDKARSTVTQLSQEKTLRAMALRALVVDAVRNMQTNRALTLAAELNDTPDHLFSDRLMYLEVLHLLKSAEFQTLLKSTQEEAAKTTDEILPLLYWMNNNNMALLAKDWAQSLAPEATASVNVRIEIARSYLMFGDWKRLRFFLADEKWGDMDYLKCAFLARCHRELEKRDTNFKTAWAEAISSTGGNGDSLLKLAGMAVQWGWAEEASDVLWRAVSKSNRSNEALNALCQLNFSRRDTAGLHRAYALLVDRNPNDAGARNNFAIFSLLLGKDVPQALASACALHEKDPASPVFASTYAFALYCTDAKADALKVMQALKPADLREPSIAAYYSAILMANGHKKEAQQYRELARGATLLPEEEKILNLAPPPVPPSPAPAQPLSLATTPAPSVPPTPMPSESPAQAAPTPSESPAQAAPIPGESSVQPTPAP